MANKQILLHTFSKLGVPLEPSRLEGPAICLTFLGIEVDSEAFELRLPNGKLHRLKEQLAEVVSKKCLSKCKLQSLANRLAAAHHKSSTSWETIPLLTTSSTECGLPPRSSCLSKLGSRGGHYLVISIH